MPFSRSFGVRLRDLITHGSMSLQLASHYSRLPADARRKSGQAPFYGEPLIYGVFEWFRGLNALDPETGDFLEIADVAGKKGCAECDRGRCDYGVTKFEFVLTRLPHSLRIFLFSLIIPRY